MAEFFRKITISKNFLLFCVLITILNSQIFSEDTETKNIVIIKSQNIQKYNTIIDGFKTSFANLNEYTIKIFNGKADNNVILNIVKKIKSENQTDLIITIGAQASVIVQKNIHKIPLIFTNVYNWKKYIRKKDNITGIDINLNFPVFLTNCKLILPKINNIGLLYSTKSFYKQIKRKIKNFDKNINLKKIFIEEIENSNLKNEIFEKLKNFQNKVDFIYLPPDPQLINENTIYYILKQCNLLHIPLITYSDGFVQEGALASIFPNYCNLGSQLAVTALKILRKKIPPKKIPVTNPIGTFFSVNFTTAKLLNFKIAHLKSMVDQSYY